MIKFTDTLDSILIKNFELNNIEKPVVMLDNFPSFSFND